MTDRQEDQRLAEQLRAENLDAAWEAENCGARHRETERAGLRMRHLPHPTRATPDRDPTSAEVVALMADLCLGKKPEGETSNG